MRVAALPPDSAWSHALFPAEPSTGRRAPLTPSTVVLDDPEAIDAFFARGAS